VIIIHLVSDKESYLLISGGIFINTIVLLVFLFKRFYFYAVNNLSEKFIDLTDQNFQRISEGVSRVELEIRERLFEQSEPVTDFFFHLEGQIVFS
jgi:CRP-like cAMP-binding protein